MRGDGEAVGFAIGETDDAGRSSRVMVRPGNTVNEHEVIVDDRSTVTGRGGPDQCYLTIARRGRHVPGR